MIYRLIIFLVLNFGALVMGGLFTSKAVISNWYVNANKAPWTPPGWVFGAAWTSIMVCFSFYMVAAWNKFENKNQLLILFILQWILNIAWNPAFFYFHQVAVGLIIITLLTLLIWYLFYRSIPTLKYNAMLLLPYGIWLLIATSLNVYFLIKN
ncbi:MAG: tryptophan-rich sensory protein [Cytophagaceae bacterium]|nr:tryptophan-rich sensory protein [Cytophagaceae bacterium]